MIVEIYANKKIFSTCSLPDITEKQWRARLAKVQKIINKEVFALFSVENIKPTYGIGKDTTMLQYGPSEDLDGLLDETGFEGAFIFDLDTGERLYRWRSRKSVWRKLRRDGDGSEAE